jgi:hypothetical protein
LRAPGRQAPAKCRDAKKENAVEAPTQYRKRMRSLPLALSFLLASFAAAAQDRFHSNYVFAGSRATSPDGALPSEHVLHTTLEPVEQNHRLYGVLDFAGRVDYQER